MKLVFVSGWAHPADSLEPIADGLGPEHDCDFTSVADLAAAPDSFAEALAETIGLPPEPCAVIGWSTGAIVALDMLAQGICEPACAVLLAPSARFCRDDDYTCGVRASALKAMQLGLQRQPEETLSAFFRECAFPASLPDIVIEHRIANAMGAGAGTLARGLDYLAETDLRSALADIGTPTLIIHGGKDRIVPVDGGRYVADSIPASRLAVHEDAGHDLPLSQPDIAIADIADFI